jgi:hypothetical protein
LFSGSFIQRPTTTAGSSDFEKLLERVHSCTQVTVPLAQRPGEDSSKISAKFKSAIKPQAAGIETDFRASKFVRGMSEA